MGNSFYLFALPSIAEGIGSVLDLAGSSHIYNEDPTPEEADFRAIKNDWTIVGQDLKTSMNKVMEEDRGKA